MFIRIWRGWTSLNDADRYSDYLNDVALSGYTDISGNIAVFLTRRTDGSREEFTLITIWEDLDSIVRFAGPDYEWAVFYPRDDEFLIDRELTVTHHSVFASRDRLPGEAGM